VRNAAATLSMAACVAFVVANPAGWQLGAHARTVAEATKDVSRMVGDSFNSSESDDLSAWVTPQPVSDDDDSAIRQVSLDDGMSMPVVETICTPPTWKDTTDNTEVQ
jgi:hypothetical protein